MHTIDTMFEAPSHCYVAFPLLHLLHVTLHQEKTEHLILLLIIGYSMICCLYIGSGDAM